MSPAIEDQAAVIDEAAAALVSLLDPAAFDEVARVSPTQLRALTLLAANPAMNVNGLAERLSVNASSASRLCDRLEALGLLDRSADIRDRREVKINLTAEARTLLDTLAAYRQRAIGAVLATMSEQSRRELVRSMAAFADAHASQSERPSAGQRIA